MRTFSNSFILDISPFTFAKAAAAKIIGVYCLVSPHHLDESVSLEYELSSVSLYLGPANLA